jgi:hypothetical protein
MDDDVVSMEQMQDERRNYAIACDPQGWRKLSIKERVQCYCDGAFIPFSAELLNKLFSPTANPEYVADFRERWPFHYRMARALRIELTS